MTGYEMTSAVAYKCGVKSPPRIKRLLEEAVSKFRLNLSDLVILTEAASGNYIFTPMIAILAGAKKVNAITKDSQYASAKQVAENTLLLADYLKVKNQLKVHYSLKPGIIGEADIVTNLGFVRPIDKTFISHMKQTAVIPLMWETWEYRAEDIDLAECIKRQILVLGTNERDKRLKTFKYVGYLAMKLAFELDIEILNSNIIIVGGGYFGESTVNAFAKAGAKVTNFKVTDGDALSDSRFKKELIDCDLLVFVENESVELLLGNGGQLSVEELLEINAGISVVHIAGKVDGDSIKKAKIPCRPLQLAKPKYMSVSTAYLGPRPVIDLHAAGLKVGEIMARARLRGLSPQEAVKEALENPLCQDFSNKQKSVW